MRDEESEEKGEGGACGVVVVGGFSDGDKSAMRGFKKVEELMNIRGIGEKSFLKLKPLVTVAAPAPKTQPQGAP